MKKHNKPMNVVAGFRAAMVVAGIRLSTPRSNDVLYVRHTLTMYIYSFSIAYGDFSFNFHLEHECGDLQLS